MKKILWIAAAVVALSLTSCQNDYKQQGEEWAQRLDELCQKQDADAVLALDDSIRSLEAKIVADGDTAGVADFRKALKDARQRNAAYISTLKLERGMVKDSVVNEVISDALAGDVDINAVTSSVDAALQKEKK